MNPKFQQKFELYNSYIALKEYQLAKGILIVKNVYSNYEKSLIYYKLAFIAHMDNNLKEAEKFYLQAIEQNFYFGEAILNLSVLYNDIGEYDKAESLYKKIYKNKSLVGEYMGQLISIDYISVADKLRTYNRLEEALRMYYNALRLNRNLRYTYLKVADIYIKLGYTDRALFEIERVLKLDTQFLPALEKLYNYYKTNDTKEAELINKKIDMAKKNRVYINE